MENLTVKDFTKMFNVNKNGEFSTSLEKTHGQLQLKNGKLVNVNRYDRGKSMGVEESGALTKDNFNLRNALVKALSSAGAVPSFIEKTRKDLGLNDGDGMAKPLSRKAVKQILNDFNATGRVCKDKTDYFDRVIRFFSTSNAGCSSIILTMQLPTLGGLVEHFFTSDSNHPEVSKADVQHLLKSMRQGNDNFRNYLEALGSYPDKEQLRGLFDREFAKIGDKSTGHPIQQTFFAALKEMFLNALDGRLGDDEVKQPVQQQPNLDNNIIQEDQDQPVENNGGIQQQQKIDNNIIQEDDSNDDQTQVKRPESFDAKIERPSKYPLDLAEFLEKLTAQKKKADQMLADLSKCKFSCLGGKKYEDLCSKRLREFKASSELRSALEKRIGDMQLAISGPDYLKRGLMKDITQSNLFNNCGRYLDEVRNFCNEQFDEMIKREDFDRWDEN